MTYLYAGLLVATLSLLAAGMIEQRRHLAQLNRIPHRVLVNGIRGKSSVTRLCAGALRGGGLITVAKTTGTAARFIHPDGSEEPVYRKFGIANIVEQIGIVRRAAAYHPDVLVIECMAVMPELQEINQVKLIKSTIGVLSNVREDHLAEMGPTLDDVARSLSRSMPVGGVCVTAERERLHILEQEAVKRNCALVVVDPDSVSDEDMAGFESVTFKENVAIALAVADLLRVNRRSAMAGMWAAPPDPGVLTVTEYTVDGKVISLANVFAANDPESTLMNIDRLLDQRAITRPLHLVINCRPDRVERNQQMGALAERIDPDRIILIGDPTHSAMATVHPRWQGRVHDLGGNRRPAELLGGIVAGVDRYAAVVTIGNIHGQGEILLAALDTLDRVRRNEPARRQITPVRPARRNGTQVRGDLYRPARPIHPRPHPHAGPPPPSRATPPAPRNPRNRGPR